MRHTRSISLNSTSSSVPLAPPIFSLMYCKKECKLLTHKVVQHLVAVVKPNICNVSMFDGRNAFGFNNRLSFSVSMSNRAEKDAVRWCHLTHQVFAGQSHEHKTSLVRCTDIFFEETYQP